MSQPNREGVLRKGRFPRGALPRSRGVLATLAAMRLLALVFLVFALSAWGQKKPEVEVVEVKAHRIEEGKLTVDGRVRVTGEKPVQHLTVVFDFLSADNDPLTTLKAEVDDDPVNPGEESSFHSVTMNPPGAVKIKVRILSGGEKQLRAANTGPFIIE